jgi:hypothetical protein
MSGLGQNLLWVSNATLLLAGIGFMLQEKRVLTAALLVVAVPHTVWIVDVVLTQLGVVSMGVATYIVWSDVSTWILTLHHFVLVPLLAYGVWMYGVSEDAWPIASGWFAVLTGVTVLVADPSLNINCAFAVCQVSFLEPLTFVNALGPWLYWLVQNAVVTSIVLWPLNVALRSYSRLV